MTGTLISLISIFVGIISANLMGYFKPKFSFGFTGNTLIGVFASIFLVKSFGRLGFDPWSIMDHGNFHNLRFITNCIVSAVGGALGLIVVKWITLKLNTPK
ncbi:hypothetical protein FNB79_11690 [Formosa sediminum]|uniref:Uncharacterized protein n=1 Tax=Formosa sediminum TaxID=2594004 RepID=A0A516GSW7_9FLAO|nr:hypothetical protein [Formosa sediminum]QDO94598.1 hypothetical protein FNB79_11690 [Formosa sediminum]